MSLHPTRLLLLLLPLTLLMGCPTGDDDDDDTTGGDPCEAGTGDLAVADENNYDFVGTLDISTTEVQELTSVTIDWSGLTLDMQGHPVDPTEIDMVSAVVFRYLSEEEIEYGLSTNTLEQADVALYVFAEVTGETSIELGELTLFGTDIDVETYFEASYGTWLITLAKGTTPGAGTVMPVFLLPVTAPAETTVYVTNDSTSLTVDANLAGVTQLEAPVDTPLTVDWDALTTDGQGNEFQTGDVDQVMVGYYETLTPTDLEEQLLDLEYVYDGMWRYDLEEGGSELDLSLLTDDGGAAFGGISGDGTWILALRCTACPNPAPPFLTTFLPCE
jgi:hypothetical protein